MFIRFLTLVAVTFTFLISGCTSYYEVTDPTTKRSYYTTKFKRHNNGGMTFTDAKTGEEITILSSEVKPISSSEYDPGVKGTADAKDSDKDKDKDGDKDAAKDGDKDGDKDGK